VSRVVLLLLLAAAGCTRRSEPETRPPATGPEKPPSEAPPERPKLPQGFQVKGLPEVTEPFLGPRQTWRSIVSRLTTLRGDARASGQDMLVTFEAKAFHVTERSGRRRTWALPEGLKLEDVPAHVLLKADLGLVVYGPDGAQIPPAPELTVLEAHLGDVEVFRLVVKGGRTFRSISTPG